MSGEAIKHVREELHLHPETARRIFTQATLYTACQEIEENQDVPPGGRREFRGVSEVRYAARKIRRLESAGNQITPYELAIVARAFMLPPGFFVQPFRDKRALEEAYRREMSGEVDPPADTQPGRQPRGFITISLSQPIPKTRTDLAKKITDQIQRNRREGASLFLLEGGTGVGKSFFISHWFRDFGEKTFGHNAHSIDCSQLSIDQFRPAIEQKFMQDEAQAAGESLQECLRSNGANLIVLDGLRYVDYQEGPHPMGGRPDHRPSLKEVVSVLSPLLSAAPKTVAILCLENNGASTNEQLFFDALTRPVQFRQFEIKALDSKEGAQFLWDLKVERLDQGQRERLSNNLHGIPLSLATAANEIGKISGAGLDRYVDAMLNAFFPAEGVRTDDQFSKFFATYLSRLGNEEADPHPKAVLRLLALMHGPVSKSFIEELTRSSVGGAVEGEGDAERSVSRPRAIRRLSKLTIDSLWRSDLPFIRITDGKIDVHAQVRQILLQELEGYAKNDDFDNYTTRQELEWIHWKCAELHWREIRDSKVPDPYLVAVIETFVHHLMARIRLLPEARRKKASIGPVSEEVRNQFKLYSERITSGQLWLLAFNDAVEGYLLDKALVATRVHGQFGAKARILESLLDATDEKRGGVPVPPRLLDAIRKEAALCWMHAGRLAQAQDAMREARRSIVEAVPKPLPVPQGSEKLELPGNWTQACELVSSEVAIDIRRGHELQYCRNTLDEYAEVARHIAKNWQDWKLYSPFQLKGVLRILTRSADIDLLMGDGEAALKGFADAADVRQEMRSRLPDDGPALQRAVHNPPLDGEAARRYALALIRSRERDPEALAKATRIIEENISNYEVKRKPGQPVSNDIIPFLVMRAAICRLSSKYTEAEAALDAIKEHEHLRRHHCTFVAEFEYEFERFRFELMMDPRVNPARLKEIRQRLHNSEHALMSAEADLLIAETLPVKERAAALANAEVMLRRMQCHMRLEDLAELIAGRSAVRRFGL